MNKKFFLIFIVILLAIGIVIIKPYYDFLTKALKVSPIKALVSMDSLKKYNDQVNILILGIAGLHYEGPDLSDSIIMANYNMKTNKLTTISIPRDIWSDTLKDKINSAHAYGEEKQPGGGGLKLAKAEVSSIVGMPIQYALVIDFDNFISFIDTLGGVDVEVERSFTDKDFPVQGKEDDSCGGDPEFRCRYQTVSFDKGLHHMDGKTALIFVRSRHAEGIEGSDFARSKRQQKVIDAIKNKVIAALKTTDLTKIKKLYESFDNSVRRDITNQQLAILGKNIFLKKNFSQNQIALVQDFFIVPDPSQYEGKYVLVPPDNDYTTIHNYIICNTEKTDTKACETFIPKPTP